MNLFELFVKIGVDDQASGAIENIAGKLGNGLKTAAEVGIAAIGAASAAITAFAADSVKVGAEFDSSMSQVAATMGVTVDEIGELRDFAQEMGSSTAFSATEAANALNYMALAGYDANTSMAMLPNVLNLAAAGGIDLASASDMVTDAQSALGLSLEETSEMVDKMARASSKSNTSVAQLGEAFLTVGGTAKNLSGGTTELATALGILADNGVKGAEGGTALRNIILSLSAPTDKAAETMENLGLQAYDAQGNLRPLEDIFTDLNGSLSTMTQGEQTQVLNELFNKVDLKSANALLATSTDRWKELSVAINDSSGAAQKMADTQLDNLNGDITLFKSALEGAQIVISDQLTPTIRDFVQFGSNGISELTEAFKENGLTGAMETLGNLLGNGVAMVTEQLPKMIEAGVSLINALIQGISDNKDLIINSVFDIIMTLSNGLLSMLPKIVSLGMDLVVSLASGIASNLPNLIPAVTDIINQITTTLSKNLPKLVSFAAQIINSLANGIMQTLPQIAKVGLDLLVSLANGIAESLPTLLPTAISVIIELAKMLTDPSTLSSLINAAGTILQELGNGLINAIPQLVNAAIEIIIGLVNFLLDPEALANFLDAAVGMVSSIVDAIIENLDLLFDAAVEIIVSLVSFLIDPKNLENLASAALEIVSKLVDGIISFATKLGEAALELLLKLVEYLSDPEKLQDLFDSGVKIVGEILSGILSMLERMRSAGEELMQKVWDAISNVDWLQLGKNVVNGILNGLKSAWDALSSWVSNAWNSLFGSKEEKITITPEIDLSAIQGNAVTTAPYINSNAQIGGGSSTGVNITQNIYSSAKTPSELMTEAYYVQQRGLVN